MSGGDRRGRDAVAFAGWGVTAMWGLSMLTNAPALRTDPGMYRGPEKATLLAVSGALLFLLALAATVLATARFAYRRGPYGPPVVSLVLGWVMVGAFVAFVAWGVLLTRNDQGRGALMASQLPWFVAGVAVLLARPREEPATAPPG